VQVVLARLLSKPVITAQVVGTSVLRDQGMDAVLLPVHNAYNPNVDRPATREVLYEIIISDIAIPAADVPWQDILSFRTETAAQR
jgi:hypothetical protein